LRQGANRKLSPADVDAARDIIQSAKVMILQLEIPMETVVHAARMATENHTRVILNPAPARPLPAALLEKVDILIANETEILVLTGADEVGMQTAAAVCRPLHDAGVESVIMTQGKEGALVTSKSGDTRVPGFVVKAVDTTAAGDTSPVPWPAPWPRQRPREAVLFANAAAALSAPNRARKSPCRHARSRRSRRQWRDTLGRDTQNEKVPGPNHSLRGTQ
jgi:ribokinase